VDECTRRSPGVGTGRGVSRERPRRRGGDGCGLRSSLRTREAAWGAHLNHRLVMLAHTPQRLLVPCPPATREDFVSAMSKLKLNLPSEILKQASSTVRTQLNAPRREQPAERGRAPSSSVGRFPTRGPVPLGLLSEQGTIDRWVSLGCGTCHCRAVRPRLTGAASCRTTRRTDARRVTRHAMPMWRTPHWLRQP
jgi:hypothetical protein